MKQIGTVTLETERLILRRVTALDVPAVFTNWASDPLSSRYLDWDKHESIETTSAYIATTIAEYNKGGYHWVVELKESKELIGNLIAFNLDKFGGSVEIGYCYGSKFWGNGYATEALRRVIEFFLLDCEVHTVEARHISGNPASGRVMQKAGMKLDAVLRDRRVNKDTKELNDMVIYSIEKDEL